MEHDTFQLPRLPRNMPKCCACQGNSIHPLKTVQKYRACHNDFRPFYKHVRISRRATPATQNDMTICFETFEKFCSFPLDTGMAEENRSIDTRREPQNEHVPRDFLNFSHRVASKQTFSYDFVLQPHTSKSMCVRGFHQFSSHVTRCCACNRICTVSPLCEALTLGVTASTLYDTSEMPRLPRKTMMEVANVLRMSLKLFFF